MTIHGKHFYFVRHAETEWNERKLCQGLRDIGLSEMGRKNSLKFAKNLSPLPIACICSSPLKRAYDTATMIQQHHPNAQLHIIDELKERDWGELEGISSEEMYAIERQEEADPLFIPGQGIETRADFKKRITIGLNKAFEHHPYPLIVSHGRLFLALCELLELPPLRQVPNLTLIEFERDGSSYHYKQISLNPS